MTEQFSQFFVIDMTSGNLTPISAGPGEAPGNLVFSTPDGKYAMGAYFPPSQGAAHNVRYSFTSIGTFSNNCVKWSLAQYLGPLPKVLLN